MTDAASINNEFWKTAYEEHGPALLGFLRRLCRSPRDAEDLLQETFVKAIHADSSLRDRFRVKPYLFQIARNLAYNEHRRPNVVPLFGDAANDIPHSTQSDAETSFNELSGRLAATLKELPEPQRIAFEQAVLNRLPYNVVAAQNNWSESQVKTYVYRARKRVIEELPPDYRPNR